MKSLAATAERLRMVRQAKERFLALGAVDYLIKRKKPFERINDDIQAAIEDPQNHNWKLLYRGSVLDD